VRNSALTAPQQSAHAQQARSTRRDVERNYQRVLEAAREVFGELGAAASMEEIAARAEVGVGTVYRRFASKDALIDELLRLSTETLLRAADEALAAPGGEGLRQYLWATGEELASHARYADLLLTRSADPTARAQLRAAIEKLTARAVAAGTVAPGVTAADVTALIWAIRGLVQATTDLAPDAWHRYLAIHLAGLRDPGPLTGAPPGP
jgi:AcrR family transcriptional regulator